MKIKKTGKLSFAQMYGRIPISKTGNVIKPKKGKGSYSRKEKHKKGWSYSGYPFFNSINNSI